MINSASGVGLVPEQVWEDPDLAASPVRHRPGDRLDRLRRRPGGRLGLAADLGPGAGTPADRRPRRRPRHRPPGHHHRTVTSTTRAPGRRPGDASPRRPTAPPSRAARTTVTGTTTPGAHGRHRVARHRHRGHARTVTTHRRRVRRLLRRPCRSGSAPTSPHRRTRHHRRRRHRVRAQVTVVGDLVGGTTVLDVDRPGRRRQRPGHLPVPDRIGLHGRARSTSPGFQVLTSGRHGLPAHHAARSWRRRSATRSARNCSTSTCTTLGRADLDGAAVPVPQLHDRPGRRVEPAAGGPGVRVAGVGRTPPASRSAPRPPSWPPPPPRRSRSRCRSPSSAPRPAAGRSRVALTGQDGFSADQASAFTATPQRVHVRGLPGRRTARRSARSTQAPCPRRWTPSRRPALPRATELNPVNGPVVLQGVTVP